MTVATLSSSISLTANATPAYFVNNVIMYDGARTTFMHRDPFKSQTYFYNNVFYNKSTTTTTTWHDTKRYLGNLGSVTFSHNFVSTKPVVSIPSMNHPTTIKSPRILIW